MAEKVTPIYDGDKRIEKLVGDLNDVIEAARGKGITAAAVIGSIEIVKQQVLQEIV